MILMEWVLYAIVSFGSGAIGFVAGQVVHWRRHPASFVTVTPAIRVTERTRRLGAMAIGLLAVVTVASSTLTSLEVRQENVRRNEVETAQRECNTILGQRLAARAAIAEADHQNTTDFVIEVRDAMKPGPNEDTYPRIVAAAGRYVERQDALAAEKVDIPQHLCR